MQQPHRFISSPAVTSLQLRAMRGGYGHRDPFHVHPMRRALCLLIGSLVPPLLVLLPSGQREPFLVVLAAFPALVLWPFSLAVLILCSCEAVAARVRRRWRPPVEDLEIGQRLIRLLRRHGYESIAQVEEATDGDLLAVPNIDPAAVREIRRAIALRNYRRWQDAGFSSRDLPRSARPR